MKKRISDSVYAETEPKRHRCEVNHVSKQSGEWIKEFLRMVEKRRGFDAYRDLRNDVLKVWKK